MSARLQFNIYLLATFVLVLVVGWAGRHTWEELRQLHRGFVSAQVEDIYVGRQIEATVLELNETVLRFSDRHNSADEIAYNQKSRDLVEGIRVHEDVLSTPEQNRLIIQIEAACTNYLYLNRLLITGRAEAAKPPASLLESLEANARPVLDLCRTLETSERDEQAQFMQDSQRALVWIQQLLTVMLILLIISAGTAIVAINRGVIDPLRLKLVETRALAARNEKLASLGILAAGVAHEIRNPLTAINVRLHSLKKNLAAHSSEQEDAQVIDHEIQRLERIVQGFLQFARPAEPKLLTVSADSVLAKVQSLFAEQLVKAGIKFNIVSVPDLWVRADPYQMEQVLINLIQNAADSIGRDGTITVHAHTGKARLGGRVTPVVMLDVIDTGKGIPPEARKRIFDPFFTTKEEGTGLGLAISLRIVEKHGGTLECRSQPDRGTTFTVLLPYSSPENHNEFNI
jgi:signal transduction histidine kinase